MSYGLIKPFGLGNKSKCSASWNQLSRRFTLSYHSPTLNSTLSVLAASGRNYSSFILSVYVWKGILSHWGKHCGWHCRSEGIVPPSVEMSRHPAARPTGVFGGVVVWLGLTHFVSCIPLDLLEKMLLILLGVLILHLIILILLIVSTAVSVSSTSFTSLWSRAKCRMEQRRGVNKLAQGVVLHCVIISYCFLSGIEDHTCTVDAAVYLNGSVLLCLPGLVCRWG